jgi:hypothetical protein
MKLNFVNGEPFLNEVSSGYLGGGISVEIV